MRLPKSKSRNNSEHMTKKGKVVRGLNEQKEKLRSVTKEGVLKLIYTLSSETPPSLVQIKGRGEVNQIYAAETRRWGSIIVRAREKPEALAEYEKEKWCIEQSAKKGVPVPEVLAIGEEPFYYTVHTRLPGKPADEYNFGGDYLNVWRQIGKYARTINSIPTKGYGKGFQLTPRSGKKYPDWATYITKRIEENITKENLLKYKIVNKNKLESILKRLDELKRWQVTTTLAHGSLAFKNTMVDQRGIVTGIIDWDSAASAPNPQHEFALAFFWMRDKEIRPFLEGYGISLSDYKEMLRDVYTLMLLKGLRVALWYARVENWSQLKKTKEMLKPVLKSL